MRKEYTPILVSPVAANSSNDGFENWLEDLLNEDGNTEGNATNADSLPADISENINHEEGAIETSRPHVEPEAHSDVDIKDIEIAVLRKKLHAEVDENLRLSVELEAFKMEMKQRSPDCACGKL